MTNSSSGHLTKTTRNKIAVYSVLVAIFYFSCFAFLDSQAFEGSPFGSFFKGMIGVFMGAGAIAIITGIILVVQSVIESERDKRQKVFDKKLALYGGIIEQMEEVYRLKEGEEEPTIDSEERKNLYFTQLKVALLARPKTFRSYSRLISEMADDDGVVQEDATKLLLKFIVDARDDLDVQEEMTQEDQQSMNESIEIAEKVAGDIQKTGRGTLFVGDDPFQQYIDQWLTPHGRASIRNMPKSLLDKKPSEKKLVAISKINQFLMSNYESREGVSFISTPTSGWSGYALGKQQGSKWCYLRFELWKGPTGDQETHEVPTLYLLKSPENDYEVPSLDNVITCQSRHGYEWFLLRICKPEQLNDDVRMLIANSFQTRIENRVLSERKNKPELNALFKQDCERYRDFKCCDTR